MKLLVIPTNRSTMTGEIVAVKILHRYISCILCKAKVDEATKVHVKAAMQHYKSLAVQQQ